MPTKAKKSVSQINVELEPSLLDRLKEFADSRGQTLKYVVGRALVRHMDNPPPLEPDPALPAGEPEQRDKPKAKPRSPRKPKGGAT